MAKAAVYACAFAFWTLAMLLMYNLVVMIAKGHIEEYWFTLIIFMFGFGVLFAEFSRYMIRLGVPKAAALFRQTATDGVDEQTLKNPLATKETIAMTDDPNTGNRILHINNAPSYHNNTPGGIIGSGPITVHQHFDKPQLQSPAPDAQSVEPTSAVPAPKMANLDELLAYAESLWGKAVAENTVRNILERAEIASCGEEKRGRARTKLYPRELAEKAIADHISASNKKK